MSASRQLRVCRNAAPVATRSSYAKLTDCNFCWFGQKNTKRCDYLGKNQHYDLSQDFKCLTRRTVFQQNIQAGVC